MPNAEKIPGAEFHNDGLIICVPKTLKKSIEKIVKEVTTTKVSQQQEQ
jgi:hypothetical protein